MPGRLLQGDCLSLMSDLSSGTIDLVYLDPPFFTQRSHALSPRSRDIEFRFDDTWESLDEYAEFLRARLRECRRLLRDSGSLFFHCDRRASHVARGLLDSLFGPDQFRSEIIWQYRRWSNSRRGLLPSHQSILYYSKTDMYVFNEMYVDYSASTNVDQLLQKRARDPSGKSAYSRDTNGDIVPAGEKRGVPLGDVWDIPFLNPKATERVGYPTQKPVLLLERIIQLSTNPGGVVLDPFCGSGTTLVASELLGREWVGFDISAEAISLAQQRLAEPRKTESRLLRVGRSAYQTADQDALEYLKGLAVVPVQRNSGIDAILTDESLQGPVLIRVQRAGESVADAASRLRKAAIGKRPAALIVVATGPDPILALGFAGATPPGVFVVDATSHAIEQVLRKILASDGINPSEPRARSIKRS